jgi:uncharacterized YccA/Bax inhibitor family protein
MMRTANPALHGKTFKIANTTGNVMTLSGTVNKTAILLAFIVASGYWSWNVYLKDVANETNNVMPLMIAGIIGSLIAAIVTIFKKQWAPISAPIYALFEGLALGGISAMYNAKFNGIVVQAVGLTLGILASLLVAYKSGLIKPTENFKLGIVAATGGIFVVYLVSFVLGMFGTGIPMIHGSGLVGIGFSIVVVIIASLNLVLDFDFIEEGVENGAPKYMEWYGAFGLMVTLVWLYLEILRLLAKLSSRK